MGVRACLAIATGMLALVAVVSGCGSPHSTGATSAPGDAAAGGRHTLERPSIRSDYMLQVQTRVLVNADGYALYMFLPDHRRTVTCTADCATDWPPVYQAGTARARAGAGVDASLIGADRDPGGGLVVTYDRWPLYTYAGDPQPGYAAGQGIDLDGGYWYLMRPDGAPLVPPGEPPANGQPSR